MTAVQSATAVIGRKGAFSSRNLPAHLSERERFDIAFREARPACVDACEMMQAEGRKVSADFEFACFGDAAFMRFRANVSRKLRSARHIATDTRDAYHLVFNTNGAPLVLSQHGREAVLQEPGHVRLVSMAEPLDVHSRTDMATLCLSISGARLREHGVNPDDLVLKPLDPANPVLCHLRRYMMCLFDADEFESDPVLSAQIETTLLDLATLALDAEGNSAILARNGRGSFLEVGTLPGTKPQGMRYRFAGFELEPRERRLLADGEPVTLTPKVFDTLVLLVEHAGHVVSRDELMATLWPRGFVTDQNLSKHIWAIRKALGASCQGDSRFIETVPKLGYRFIEPVERVDASVTVRPVPGSFDEALGPASGDIATALAALSPVASAQPMASEGDRRMLRRRSTDWSLPEALPTANPKQRRGRWIAAATLLAIVVIGGAGGLLWWRSHATPGHVPPTAPGTAVAIVAFRNLSDNPKDAWLGPALTEMISTEVTASGRMHVVPGELVRSARKDLPAPSAGGYAPAGLASLRKGLDADYVISGSYLISGTGPDAKVRVDLVLQDARSDMNIVQFAQSQSASNLLKLVASAGVRLRTKLGLPVVAPGAARQLAGAQPPSPDVARHVGFALDALHAYNPARARDELLQAVAEAPGYATAYVLLSRAWSKLGYHDKARAAIEQAAAHAKDLPARQRLQIQAQQQVLAYKPVAAAADYQELIKLDPKNPEPRRKLVEVLSDTDKTAEVEKALRDWHALAGAADDPRWELAAAHFAQKRGDFEGGTKHARRALDLALAHDARGIKADAELQYGVVLAQDGPRYGPQAVSMLRQAVHDYRALGDIHGEAYGYEMLGKNLHGDVRAKREAEQRAMATYQRLGDLDGQARIYSSLSRLLWAEGDGDGASTALKHAIHIHHQVGDFHSEVWATAGLARMQADTSANDDVVALYRKLINMESRLGDVTISAYTQANYGDLLRERGQLDDARNACAKAEHEGNIKGFADFLNTIQLICAGVVRDGGDVARAEAELRQTSLQKNGLRGPLAVAAVILPLAKMEIAQRKWKAARDLLNKWRGSRADASDAMTTSLDAGLNVLLARCYAALGDSVARDLAAAQAKKLRQRITEHRSGFEVDLSLAQLQGNAGQRDAAVAKLRALAADADNRHWMASALEARLAAYQLLEHAKDPTANALHDRIQATAKAHGFKWVLARLDEQVPPMASVAVRN